MPKLNIIYVALAVCFLLISYVKIGCSIEPVVIEFFYRSPCMTCPTAQEDYKIYVQNNQTVNNIERDYGSKVLVKRIWFYLSEATEKRALYGIGVTDWNSIVVNYRDVIKGYANETYIRELVDYYIAEPPSPYNITILSIEPPSRSVNIGDILDINVTVKNEGNQPVSFNMTLGYDSNPIGTIFVDNLEPNDTGQLIFRWDSHNVAEGNYTLFAHVYVVQSNTIIGNDFRGGSIEVKAPPQSIGVIAVLMLAFTFGFFETFSPCLIIMLSFILNYTIGKTTQFKEGFLDVMIFGIGFVVAALLIGVVFGLIFLSLPMLQVYLMWPVCIFAIFFGFSLLGLLNVQIETKPLIRKLAGKYVATYTGMFILGFVFYFLDPCIAPIFMAMAPLLLPNLLPLILFIFCLGVIIPFVAIGVFAGSVSKLVRSTYRHRFKIRAISGLILIGYALYIIFSYLIP